MIGAFFGLLHDNVDLLFNIINVILLLTIGYIAFKHYMFPSLKDKFHEHLRYRVDLKDKAKNLVHDQHKLKALTEKQTELCDTLKDKVEKWNRAVLQNREYCVKEKKLINQYIKEKVAVQSANYYEQMMLKQIVPNVKENLETKLRSYFDKDNHAQNYVEKVLNYIKK